MKTNTITRYEPITAPTPAPGWTAVYDSEGKPVEDMLIGWVLCRVTEERFVDDRVEPVSTNQFPNMVCGLVETECGTEVPNTVSNFVGYRHTSTSLKSFCSDRFASLKSFCSDRFGLRAGASKKGDDQKAKAP